ncbi:MAG: NADPH:quinone oxidoreductase family protein [Immundisolibacterales bacterium]|nr:NADPH:quinone oxidoreductase family protein [Immundisolibacterales bacterium]
MKALLCKEYGPPDTLVLEDIESPEPGEGQVRLRVRACGVNFPDLLLIENKYQERPALPFSPGAEVAGDVIALGPGVTGGIREGDRVIAMIGSRGFQEETLADAARCVPLPDSMDYATGAAFTLTYGTSYHALVDRGRIAPGETLLVLGATGGVGTAALDIARNLGARAIAAGGSDEKLATVREIYGVRDVVNYSKDEETLKDRVNRLTGGRGADVIYDPIGGEAFQQTLRCIAWGGRILVVGFAADGANLPSARTNLLLLKGSSLVGVFWGRFTRESPARSARNFDTLFGWYADGRLRPHVSHRFPLEEGIEALRAVAERRVVGKCVVVMDD